LIHAILIHMYMAFWVKGSIKGMIEGKVSRRWAQKHHPRWYRDVERLEAQKENREGIKLVPPAPDGVSERVFWEVRCW